MNKNLEKTIAEAQRNYKSWRFKEHDGYLIVYDNQSSMYNAKIDLDTGGVRFMNDVTFYAWQLAEISKIAQAIQDIEVI